MSAPPVRIESKAWTDHRYTALALELGLPDRDVALIRCATIWRWQTEHYTDEAPTYVVPRSAVVGALNSLKGPEALVAADLAELLPDGRLRIKGGYDDRGKSRIDWLWRDRQRQREKGRQRHDQAGDRVGAGGGRFQPVASRQPAAHQPDVGARPAEDQPATSSPDSGLRSQDPDLVSGEPGAGESIADLVAFAYAELNAARLAIDPTASPCQLMTERPLVDRLLATPVADRRRQLTHNLSVLVARAGRAKTVDDLRMGYLGGERAWPALADATVAGATSSRGRDGPGGRSAPRATGAAAGQEALDLIRRRKQGTPS